jgi:hypothetical protein
MENQTIKTALITGATKGIGYELTKLFARDSCNLVLVARDAKKLNEIKTDLSEKYTIDILIIVKDLSKPNAASEIFNETVKKKISINILVNNAGIGDFGKFQNQDFHKIGEILQINIISLTELTRLFMSSMLIKNKGQILNISSMAAFQPGPYMAVYYASKAYVQSFSEAITSELKGTGVSVTTLCPGPTKSGFQKEVGSENSNLAKYKLLSSSEEVAKDGYKALQGGKEIEIPGLLYSSLFNTSKVIPRKAKTKIIKKLQEFNRN